MIIGFTGTQSGMSQFQKDTLREILEIEKCTEFVHGDCYGADKQANDIAATCGLVTIFPPDNPKKRAWCFNPNHDTKNWQWHLHTLQYLNTPQVINVRWWTPLPYMERNQLIVNHPEILIACPKEIEHTLRSGTWATIRMGWKKQKMDKSYKVVIIPPLSGRG